MWGIAPDMSVCLTDLNQTWHVGRRIYRASRIQGWQNPRFLEKTTPSYFLYVFVFWCAVGVQ